MTKIAIDRELSREFIERRTTRKYFDNWQNISTRYITIIYNLNNFITVFLRDLHTKYYVYHVRIIEKNGS